MLKKGNVKMTTTATHRGFGRTAVLFLAFASFLAASSSLSAEMTITNVAANAEFSFTGATNADTVELVVNAGATVVLPPSGRVFAYVYMTGTGAVTLKKPENYVGGDQVTFFRGLAADSTVTVLVKDVATVNVGWANPTSDINYPVADVANMTFEQTGGKLMLTNKCTARTLPSSFEIASGATVAIQGTNPLRLGSSFTLTDYDVVVMKCASIPDGCTITVQPGRTLGLKPANTATRGGNSTYKWNWAGTPSTFDETFNIILGGKGARVLCRNTANKLLLFTPVTGTGEVLFRPDNDNSGSLLVCRGVTYAATESTPIAIPVNTAADPVVSDAWKSKVAHWFDASDTTTVIKYTRTSTELRNNFEGQYPVVVGWLDHVKGSSDTFLYSRDAQNGHYPYDLPYLVAGGLNGKDYLSFGVYYPNINMSQVDSEDCPANKHIQRWIQFVDPSTSAVTGNAKPSGSYTTIADCKYCIMVFGSQFGGGKSILGDQNGDDAPLGNLARNGSLITQAWMVYNGYSMMVDGVGINPKTAKPNGGWQIISLDMSATNTVLDCLGGHNVTKRSDSSLLNGRSFQLTGGQNYAEVLLFNEVPTDAERIACEAYLAEKWGLKSTHSARAANEAFSELSGGDGTTMTIADYESTENSVTVTNPIPEEVTIAGNYRGTINIASGKTLVVSDRPAPPTPYDMPQQSNIVAWFDPSLDGAIDFTTSYPNGVARLYSRTAADVDNSDGAYWMGMNSSGGIETLTGRFPFLVETAYSGASGLAPTMKWMDFTTNAVGDTMGNTLRSHTLPTTDSDLTGSSSSNMTFRSLFMAIDTSVGGGNPIFDEVGLNGAFKARIGYGEDYTKPIWSENNAVTMAHTWLDTNEVNGTTTGYNGRGEVLGFETTADFTTRRGLFFGYYNPNHGQTNYEHIAETIIYSTALADAERLTVQKYLMAKWFGDMNGGEFSDLSGATVTGAGNVKSASLRNLPSFDAGFTGVLSGGSDMTFTIDSQRNASAAIDAIAIDHAVTLDSVCTVTVTLKAGTNLSTYTLLTVPSGSLVGKTFKGNVVNETGMEVRARLVVSDTTLSLKVSLPPGILISIQ